MHTNEKRLVCVFVLWHIPALSLTPVLCVSTRQQARRTRTRGPVFVDSIVMIPISLLVTKHTLYTAKKTRARGLGVVDSKFKMPVSLLSTNKTHIYYIQKDKGKGCG